MIIVISPAKKLDFENPAPTDDYSQAEFLPQAQQLVKELKKLNEEQLMQLMRISPKLAKLNWQRFDSFTVPFNLQNAKQSLLAFTGDVYAGLNAATLSAAQLAFAQQHLRILSGLYGVLRPLDLMQAYRLEMGTRFKTTRFDNLYQFWGDDISMALNAAIDRATAALPEHLKAERVLLNLASVEYFKAVSKNALDAKIVNVHFKQQAANKKLRTIGIYAKRARGLMCRYIIENKITSTAPLQGFNWEGYVFRRELSTPQDLVFSRDSKP